MSHRNSLHRFLNAFAILSMLVLVQTGPAGAQSAQATDWDRWAANNPDQTASIDHKHFTTFLESFGRSSKGTLSLAYGAMKGQGITFLDAYIKSLEGIYVSRLARDEQLAYWLNLYNAGVIRTVAMSSIPRKMDDHRGTPAAPGDWWNQTLCTVEGHDLSLNDIETMILARHWSADAAGPMWLYGLTYAAKGSPPLPLAAFTGPTVNAQLAEIAGNFVNRTANVRPRKNGVELSRLYLWHRAAFGDDTALITHIKSRAKSRLAGKLDKAPAIIGYKFDWHTNAIDVPREDLRSNSTGGRGGGGAN